MKKNIYKDIYKNGSDLKLRTNPRIKIMLKTISDLNLKNKNILDIGCYDGTLLASIENRGNHFFGIEASDYGTKESLKKNIDVRQFFFDDIRSIPFEDDFFDLIIAGEIIEHIYDTDFFLKEIRRLLKPGGYLLLSTPNIASLGRRIFLLLGKNPIIETSPNQSDSSGHIRYFTFESLESLLKKNKFDVLLSKSDIVNFSISGKIKSKILAKTWKELGQSIICLTRTKK